MNLSLLFLFLSFDLERFLLWRLETELLPSLDRDLDLLRLFLCFDLCFCRLDDLLRLLDLPIFERKNKYGVRSHQTFYQPRPETPWRIRSFRMCAQRRCFGEKLKIVKANIKITTWYHHGIKWCHLDEWNFGMSDITLIKILSDITFKLFN